ncbi:MAG TPA: hypothetical protein VFK40_05005 [Nitrososphaeraceae archaeon]|nr:hypothetical protein [Nitrososphaeraceae archaeon]
MSSHSKRLPDYNSGLIFINPKFNKLITALKSAMVNEYKLDEDE